MPRRADNLGIAIESVTESQSRLARDACHDFGKGQRPSRAPQLLDCFTYALAKTFDEPLLFRGRDFIHVGLTPALREN